MEPISCFGQTLRYDRTAQVYHNPEGGYWPCLKPLWCYQPTRYECRVLLSPARRFEIRQDSAEEAVAQYLYFQGGHPRLACLAELMAGVAVVQFGRESYWRVGRLAIPVHRGNPEFIQPVLKLDVANAAIRVTGIVGQMLGNGQGPTVELALLDYWANFRERLQADHQQSQHSALLALETVRQDARLLSGIDRQAGQVG